MPTTVSNIKTSQNLKVGATTITAHTVTAIPLAQIHSFHDCTDPSLMNSSNCVWPSAYVGGSNLKTHAAADLTGSAVGVSVNNGLTVDMKNGGGNISVTFT